MGRVPHALCLSTEAFMWVRFHEMRGRESVLASTVAEDWSGSAWPLSQNRAWMLNSIASADAEQMMEQIKEVPACPQPESTGEARQGRPGAGRPEGGGPTGEARGGEAWLGGSLAWGGLGGRTWSAWAAALSPTPAGLPTSQPSSVGGPSWGQARSVEFSHR